MKKLILLFILATPCFGQTFTTASSDQPNKDEITHCSIAYKDLLTTAPVYQKLVFPVSKDDNGLPYCFKPVFLNLSKYTSYATFIKGAEDAAGNVNILVESPRSGEYKFTVYPTAPTTLIFTK